MTRAAAPARRLVTWIQVAVSATLLAALVLQARPRAIVEAMGELHPGWLAVALAIKTLGLFSREVHLWCALLPARRVPLRRVMGIGFAAGLVNVVLPARTGDVLSAALLRAELRVPLPSALAAVAVTSTTEALGFGLFLLAALLAGAGHWSELVGVTAATHATRTVAVAAAAALVLAVAAVSLARRLGPPEPHAPRPRRLLQEGLHHLAEAMSRPRLLAANLVLSIFQVGVVVGATAALLPALGLDVPVPLLVATMLVAVGSLAAIALPPTLGAGPAATAVFVLGFFGVDEAHALAWAATSWLVSTLPQLLLGFLPLLHRIGRLGVLLAERPVAPALSPGRGGPPPP